MTKAGEGQRERARGTESEGERIRALVAAIPGLSDLRRTRDSLRWHREIINPEHGFEFEL